MRARKSPFTLLELMVCLVILAGIGCAVGFQIQGSLSHARFEASVKKVKHELEKLQILSLTYGSDMHVRLIDKQGKVALISRTDEAALSHLNNMHIPLDGVLAFDWEGKQKDSNVKQLDFDILSNGSTHPPFLLELKGKTRKLYIDMRSPLLITLSPTKTPKKEYSIPVKPNLHSTRGAS